MKMLFYLVVLLLISFVSAPASETPEQLFDQANQAYQAGKFQEAAQKYETILQAGKISGELYYNLGNAYYKSGNIAKAILNYERALKLIPGDEDLLHNLQLSNLNITDKIEPAPRLFIWDWWDAIISAFSLTGITWIAYTFFLLTIAFLVVIVLSRSYALRRGGFVGAGASVLFLAISAVIFVAKLNSVEDSSAAIVTSSIATVKNSPDQKSSDAFVLHSGVKVFITDSVNEWVKIRLGDGKVGWMQRNAAEVI